MHGDAKAVETFEQKHQGNRGYRYPNKGKILVDEHGISRDIVFCVDMKGHYFELWEGGVAFYQSERFVDNDEAYTAGLAFLNAMHEARPLQVHRRDDILITAR